MDNFQHQMPLEYISLLFFQFIHKNQIILNNSHLKFQNETLRGKKIYSGKTKRSWHRESSVPTKRCRFRFEPIFCRLCFSSSLEFNDYRSTESGHYHPLNTPAAGSFTRWCSGFQNKLHWLKKVLSGKARKDIYCRFLVQSRNCERKKEMLYR